MEQLKKMIQSKSMGETFEEIALKKLVIGKQIIEQLPVLMDEISLNRLEKIVIVADETSIKRGNAVLKEAIAHLFEKEGFKVKILTLTAGSDGLLHADMAGAVKVQSEIQSGVGIIGIGGGTIADMCKYGAYLSEQEAALPGEVPLIICQTATSGSAFGANQAVIFKDGVKRTLHARYPSIVVVDLDVIESAPRKINIAGFGDMSGILISSVDWYVSSMLGMSDGYSEMVVEIMQDSGKALLSVDRLVGSMSAEGIEVLAKVLIMMGIVSSMGFGTAPISGFDHMISHALDFEGMATGRQLSLHGAQVGLGAAYASVAYNYFVAEFSPDKIDINRCYPSEQEAYADLVKRFEKFDIEGKAIQEIWAHYKEKLAAWKKQRHHFEKFLNDWDKPRGPKDQISSKLIEPEQIIEALNFSGNPLLPEEVAPPVSREIMKFAFLNARFMRNRFIMADIMGLAGLIDEHFWQKVDKEVRRILATKRS